MNKTNFSAFIKSVRKTVVKHSPEILTGIGIAGLLTTTVLAVKATPKALAILEEERSNREQDRENGVDECFAPEKISAVDKVKLCWKCYIPAAVTGLGSTACIIGASSVNARRNAALATAYAISETALKEYQDKVVETIGEKKEQVIREKIDKDHVDKNPVSKNEVIVTQKGNTLCYDYYSGRYFESDIEQVKRAINNLNSAMLRDDYVSLNELYDELGLSRTGIGDTMGWNIGRIGRDLVEPCISSQIADDGRPCIVVSCNPAPKHGYSNFA